MDVIFIAGMIDRKLQSKIAPLQNSNNIDKIFLIRKKEFKGNKVFNYHVPKKIINSYILSELFRLFQIILIILRFRPKYIVGAGLIPHGIYTIILSKIFFRKSVLLLMGELEFPLNKPPNNIKQKILTRIVKVATIIGVRGSNSKERVLSLGYKNQIFIPNNVFSFDDFNRVDLSKENDIIFIGNIQHEKRIDILLDIIHMLKVDKNMKANVLIVGDGKLKPNLMAKSEKLGLSEFVIFLPFTDKNKLNTLINTSKICALTSEFEGLPMVLIETMACGVPSVSFDIADISDIIKNNVNGFLVDFDDADAFVEKVHLLLTNDSVYKKLSENCLSLRKTHKELYSVGYNTNLWEKVL